MSSILSFKSNLHKLKGKKASSVSNSTTGRISYVRRKGDKKPAGIYELLSAVS